jgi:hypothetical protein
MRLLPLAEAAKPRFLLKELNLRWRVYVEIPKPSRVDIMPRVLT